MYSLELRISATGLACFPSNPVAVESKLKNVCFVCLWNPFMAEPHKVRLLVVLISPSWPRGMQDTILPNQSALSRPLSVLIINSHSAQQVQRRLGQGSCCRARNSFGGGREAEGREKTTSIVSFWMKDSSKLTIDHPRAAR
jgi:hypothetical protein